jgi:hypothetical protein
MAQAEVLPIIIFGISLDELTSRNEFYNSKAGHAYLARLEAEEEAKKMKQPTKG